MRVVQLDALGRIPAKIFDQSRQRRMLRRLRRVTADVTADVKPKQSRKSTPPTGHA